MRGLRERVSSNYKCDVSGVVYLLEYRVCGKQYVGSIFTPFRTRFDNYQFGRSRFLKEKVGTQAELLDRFSDVDHHGFLEDVYF